MLVLQRQKSERINIGPDVVVEVLEIKQGKVKLGITAPSGKKIERVVRPSGLYVSPEVREKLMKGEETE